MVAVYNKKATEQRFRVGQQAYLRNCNPNALWKRTKVNRIVLLADNEDAL